MTRIAAACRTFRCTPSKLRKLVASGAVHPIVLVEDDLRERMRSYAKCDPVLHGFADYASKPFPWGHRAHLTPLVRDPVAAALQSTLRHVYASRDAYYAASERIEDVVFGSVRLGKSIVSRRGRQS